MAMTVLALAAMLLLATLALSGCGADALCNSVVPDEFAGRCDAVRVGYTIEIDLSGAVPVLPRSHIPPPRFP